ncbi:MAG: hypothetical protein H5T86_16555, partial [Armatimonadetes bacterium]|nr:hypothetical protein [Armatimonadota bacterium]
MEPALAVVIEGYDEDWTSSDSREDDPNEPVPDYADIAVTLFRWERGDGTYCFYFRTHAPYQHQPNDYAAILIDGDTNAGTGGSFGGKGGLEYYLYWDLGPAVERTVRQATLYTWNEMLGRWDAANTYPVARGVDDPVDPSYSFVEWSLPRTAINTDNLYWAAYYRASATEDDYAPDDVRQAGFLPEPSAAALVAIGLLAVGKLRRSRSEARLARCARVQENRCGEPHCNRFGEVK